MIKKTKQILVIMMFLLLILANFNIVHASSTVTCKSIDDSASDFVDSGKEQLEDFDDALKDEGETTITGHITQEVRPVVRILSVGGILVIGICMVILGIQWVMAKPSPEAQSKLKHRFVALAVAAGVMFGSYTIWSLIVSIMDDLS